MEITEEHQILSASTVFFNADKDAQRARRTASVGPGLILDRDDDSEESAGTSHQGTQRSRHSLWLPGTHQRLSTDLHNLLPPTPSHTTPPVPSDDIPSPPYSAPPAARPWNTPASVSFDGVASPRSTLRQSTSVFGFASRHHSSIDPHTSAPPSRMNSNYSRSTLGEHTSSSSSNADVSLSRHTSNDDAAADGPSRGRPPLPPRLPSNAEEASRNSSPNPSAANLTQIPGAHAHFHPSTSSQANRHSLGGRQSPERDRDRGRRRSRFSLATVSNAFLEAVKERVRSNSPEGEGSSAPDERSPAAGVSREPSLERIAEGPARGVESSKADKRKSALEKLTGAFRLDTEETAHKTSGEGWKEFRKGREVMKFGSSDTDITFVFRNLHVSDFIRHPLQLASNSPL